MAAEARLANEWAGSIAQSWFLDTSVKTDSPLVSPVPVGHHRSRYTRRSDTLQPADLVPMPHSVTLPSSRR